MPANVARRGRHPKHERRIYDSREEVMTALEQRKGDGIPFFVRAPDGRLRYTIAGSNAAALYDVARDSGWSVRSCKATPGDPTEAVETLKALPSEQRRQVLKELLELLKETEKPS